jgi:mono/diheme cytochrome c family protein
VRFNSSDMAGFPRDFPLALSLLLTLAAAGGCKRRAPVDQHVEAAQLFDSMCATCHGRDGRGGVPAAEGLPAPRNFCDAVFQASRTDAQLSQVIREGKPPMPPFNALLDDRQLALLVAHIRGFNPKK